MDNISSMKTLPAPVDLSHHFSRVTKNRAASNVKDFYKYFSIPGIGNLAGGTLLAPMFSPITSADMFVLCRLAKQ